MQSKEYSPESSPTPDATFPDVTWGDEGIDSAVWADGEPWAELLSPASPTSATTKPTPEGA